MTDPLLPKATVWDTGPFDPVADMKATIAALKKPPHDMRPVPPHETPHDTHRRVLREAIEIHRRLLHTEANQCSSQWPGEKP